MTDQKLILYLLGVLDALMIIAKESRNKLRFNRKPETQDEFRLNPLLDAVAVKESDFLKPKMPDNVIQLKPKIKFQASPNERKCCNPALWRHEAGIFISLAGQRYKYIPPLKRKQPLP